MENVYVLVTFYLDDTPDKHGLYYRNDIKQGFWSSKEEAEKYLLDEWYNLHEYWNNAAVIEEYRMGPSMLQLKPKQWWYFSQDMTQKLPVLLESTPDTMKYNKGRQSFTLGRY